MTNPLHDKRRQDGQEIGLVAAAVLLAIALAPLLHEKPIAQGFAMAGLAVLVLAILMPRQLAPVRDAWMKLALLLSKIVTPVAMGLIFFGLIAPIGLLLRILGKDLLWISPRRRKADTLWKDKDQSILFDMKRQF
jgi:hypothetical protein